MGYLPAVLVAAATESARLGLSFSGWLTESQTESVYAGVAGLSVAVTTITSATLAFKTVHIILSWRFNGERVAKEREDAPTEADGESMTTFYNELSIFRHLKHYLHTTS